MVAGLRALDVLARLGRGQGHPEGEPATRLAFDPDIPVLWGRQASRLMQRRPAAWRCACLLVGGAEQHPKDAILFPFSPTLASQESRCAKAGAAEHGYCDRKTSQSRTGQHLCRCVPAELDARPTDRRNRE